MYDIIFFFIFHIKSKQALGKMKVGNGGYSNTDVVVSFFFFLLNLSLSDLINNILTYYGIETSQ